MLQSTEATASPIDHGESCRGFDDEAAFLDYLLDDAWDILAQGVRVPFTAAHTPTLATIRDGNPTVRTVVLRAVSRAASMIFVHADRRSSKVQELLAQPSCSLHIFDAGRRVQLRIEAQASIHVDDEIADAQWTALQARLRAQQRRGLGRRQRQHNGIERAALALAGRPVTFVPSPNYEAGLSESLKAGIAAIPATARASFGIYSDEADVAALARGIERVTRIFG